MTELVKAGGSLAIAPDQTAWTPQQQAWLQQAGVSDEVTAAELSGFLHLCQRTQLDPFSRQIYLIGRWDSRAGRKVFTPQTGIDGYRVVAHRVVANSRDSFGYEDTLWCDEAGRWRDVWLLDKPPAAVKVTVLRNGQRFSAVALYREYVQTGWENKPVGLWGKMPASQLAKCGEALALRKAFPHDLAGVYTAEEMAQADNPASGPARGEGGTVHRLRPSAPATDEWSTPAPGQQQDETTAAAAQADSDAQAFAAEAAEAAWQGPVRDVWRRAGKAALDSPCVPPGQSGAELLGAYLTRLLRELPAEEPENDGEVIDGEVVPDAPADEHAAAVAELRTVAAEHGLTDVDDDAHRELGMPLADAPPEAIRRFTALMRGAA